MNPPSAHRLPALLEAAAQRMKLAARAAVERTVESLGLAALATSNIFQRDALLGAQFELNRKSAMFALAFNDSLDERLMRDCAPRTRDVAPTSWDAMGLVDDKEVERKITADRFGLEISHACEWELRELDGYMGSLLGATQERNPLRPEVVGMAMIKGIEAVSERADVRALLHTELGRVLGLEMRATYAAIVNDLRQAGVQPAGLSLRSQLDRGGRHLSGYDSLRDLPESVREAAYPGAHQGSHQASHQGSHPGSYRESQHTGRSQWSSHGGMPSGGNRFGPSTRSGQRMGGGGGGGGATFGRVDAHMMSLIRRLAHVDPGFGSDVANG